MANINGNTGGTGGGSGSGFKKMAQRAMMRGNRGQAMAIEEHGRMGMQSNLKQGTGTGYSASGTNNSSTGNSADIVERGNMTNLRVDQKIESNTAAEQTKKHIKSDDTNNQNSGGLGGSILGSIQ